MPPRVTLVAVGSKNPAKTKGTKAAFARIFHDVELKAVDVGTSVKIQPFSLEETAEGARTRALLAINSAKADFGVGVEAGIIVLPDDFFLNVQIAAVADSGGRVSFGSSSGFPLPSRFVMRIKREQGELDRYSHELTGAKKIREEEGVVYHLTKGRLSRSEMTEQCVSMALVPWLNGRVYGHA